MNSKGLFTQIVMIALAVGIAMTYIRPTLGEVSEKQNSIQDYQDERSKISDVNNKLAALVERLNSVSASDQNDLLTYLPDQIDSVAVQRTIKLITEETGVLLSGVTYDGLKKESQESLGGSGSGERAVPHVFSLQIDGTYEQIKSTLTLFEQNNYPLEIHQLNLSVTEADFMSADVTLVTYSRTRPEPSLFQNN